MSERRRARAGLGRGSAGGAGVSVADDSVRGALAARYAARLESAKDGTPTAGYFRSRLDSVLSGDPVTFGGWELRGYGLDNSRNYLLTGGDSITPA